MPGKSATGRNEKVPYYEYSSAVEHDSCLTKKTFKCDPHRVPEKILGPLVWNEFLRLLENEHFILSILEKLKKVHEENDSAKEYECLKAKLYDLNYQLDALAERIAILPKSISAIPLFKQMEKLETHKKEIEEKLLSGTEVI